MKNLTLAILACAVVGASSQSAFAATDWQFKRSEVREMRLTSIVDAFKEQTGRDSIFKNRSDANISFAEMRTERRQAIRARLVGRLQAISERLSVRDQRFAERYAERWFDHWKSGANPSNTGGRIPEEEETLPWDRPGYGGEEGEMPEVPLPATVWLLGSAIGFMGLRARRRAAKQTA